MRPTRRRPADLPLLHLLPNLVTILGLCAGLTAIRFAIEGAFDRAAALIVFAAAVDGVDGLIARRLDAASDFGAELDSLADFVNFGVAPALVVHQAALAGATNIAWIFPLIFAVCCCLRLARFNVNRGIPLVGRAYFTGVPAPAGALLALLPVFAGLAGIVSPASIPWLVAPWLGLVALLMVSRLRTLSPKGLRIPRSGSRWILVAGALVVGLMLTRFWLLMIAIDAAYVASLIYSAASGRRRLHF